MYLTRTTELRHMPAIEKASLGQILSHAHSWKKLMGKIPKVLIDAERLDETDLKYNSNDIQLIEDASFQSRVNAAEILFEEWGTSGRIRPTLSHLLQLLVKVELFRAADYVAVNLLNENPPERPAHGPAAKVDITLSSLIDDDDEIEYVLSRIEYPHSSVLDANLNKSNKVLPDIVQKVEAIPCDKDLIEFSKVSMSKLDINAKNDLSTNYISTNEYSVADDECVVEQIEESQNSIKNEQNCIDSINEQYDGIPCLSELNVKDSMEQSAIIPDLSELHNADPSFGSSNYLTTDGCIESAQSEYSAIIPNISELHCSPSNNNTETSDEELFNIPNISSLNIDN